MRRLMNRVHLSLNSKVFWTFVIFAILVLDVTNVSSKQIEIKLFKDSWNAIGVPYKDAVIDESGCKGKYVEKVYYWNPLEGKYKYVKSLKEMQAGKGYWVYVKDDCTLKVSGSIPIDVSDEKVIFYPGWNFISSMQSNGKPASSQDLETKCHVEKGPYYYNPTKNKWEIVDKLEEGKAYWVKCLVLFAGEEVYGCTYLGNSYPEGCHKCFQDNNLYECKNGQWTLIDACEDCQQISPCVAKCDEYQTCQSGYLCLPTNDASRYCLGPYTCEYQFDPCDKYDNHYCCKCEEQSECSTNEDCCKGRECSSSSQTKSCWSCSADYKNCTGIQRCIIMGYYKCFNGQCEPGAGGCVFGEWSDCNIDSTSCICDKDCGAECEDESDCSPGEYCGSDCKCHPKQPEDDPCDNQGTWQKYGILCCEGDCTKDENKVRGFCLDKNIAESRNDLEIVKEDKDEYCVKCKNDDCCSSFFSLCLEYDYSSPIGCNYKLSYPSPTLKCQDADGNVCLFNQDATSNCYIKESSGKLGPIYCYNCPTPPTTPPTTQPPTTTPPTTPPTTQPPTTTPPTTPPTTTSSSTTTTTLPPQVTITCEKDTMYVGESNACRIDNCNEGKVLVLNEGFLLMEEDIKPQKLIEFEAKTEGTIRIIAICTDPFQTPEKSIEVKKGLTLLCSDTCFANEECECEVEECEDGELTMRLISKDGSIVDKDVVDVDESPFNYTFIPSEEGIAKIRVSCYEPIQGKKQTEIAIEPGVVTREIEVGKVECTKESCEVEVKRNRVGEDVIVYLHLIDESTGKVYYSSVYKVEAGEVGSFTIPLEKVEECPEGRRLKMLLLAYKESDPENRIWRSKEYAFRC